MKDILKMIYRTVVPTSVQKLPLIIKFKEKLLGHNWVYSSDYYETNVEKQAVRSARTIANSICSDFDARSIIDVGCGTGALLEALRDRGCDVRGLEYSEAALKYCRKRHLDVTKFDLEKDELNTSIKRNFDVAVSMEVAEHLPESVADRYVDLLTQLSQVVIFTAAPPGQGGTNHINEQPSSYWIVKFQERGFSHRKKLSQSWMERWKSEGKVLRWYSDNLMIFQQKKTVGSES